MRSFSISLPNIAEYDKSGRSDFSTTPNAITVLLRSAELGEGLLYELPDSLVTLDTVQAWRSVMKETAVTFYKNYVSPFKLKTSVFTEEII